MLARLIGRSVLGCSTGRLEPEILLKFQVVPFAVRSAPGGRKPERVNEALGKEFLVSNE